VDWSAPWPRPQLLGATSMIELATRRDPNTRTRALAFVGLFGMFVGAALTVFGPPWVFHGSDLWLASTLVALAASLRAKAAGQLGDT
jgi:hypothetical protein